MTYFIKQAIEGDKRARKYFAKFGKGIFENKAVMDLNFSRMTITGSYECVPDIIVWLCSNFECEVDGIILSKKEIDDLIMKKGLRIKKITRKKKEEILIYEVEGKCKEIEDLNEEAYFLLLDAKCGDVEFKCKKKVKPQSKKQDKFFSLKIKNKKESEKIFNDFVKKFLFDFALEKGKKIKISHTFLIDEIIIPKELEKEKDFAKIRQEAKRKGKIIRNIEVDKKSTKKEYSFCV